MEVCVLTRWQTTGDCGPRRPALAGRPEVCAWETLAAAGDLVLARVRLAAGVGGEALAALERSPDCGVVWAALAEPSAADWAAAGPLGAAQARALRAFLRSCGVGSAQAARLARPGRARRATADDLAAWLRARSRRLPPRGGPRRG